MDAICTIITGNYGHYALALYDSVEQFNKNVHFYIFVSDNELSSSIQKKIEDRTNIFVLNKNDLSVFKLAQQLEQKYAINNQDAYRWGMKPIILRYLLETNYAKAIYVDCDIHFFSDFNFLFHQLNHCNILLSPHFRSSNPKNDLLNFKLNFLDGIYNGGFIGASIGGIEALNYWAELCLYNCEVNRNEGFYVDQRYLDILHSRFEGVDVIRHKGCNIANWNQDDCKRVKLDDGTILINGQFPIVFIHFTNSFFRGVLDENDELLVKYLDSYKNSLLKYDDLDVIELYYLKGKMMTSRSETLTISKKKVSFFKKILKKIKFYG
ncbi:hypothetical protein EC396_10780 [Lutibacter sp. HS1-25]|uniref:hypothetical protein n=1 Tax=Lutibacter sp. HS1-25 TaxID=2485000 RepID=UPI0010111BA0|nr:hypothetical protein [Lutibacter sp. HS1-25]RXP52920.1 hypothetical protein EC396_10780 [Lutibacter sp. HS1-25]